MSDSINIAHLAMLARISLDAQTAVNAEQDLRNVIAMIDAMQAIPTDDVEPMAHPHDGNQRLREDVVTEDVDLERFQANAPETELDYYLVPRVVE